MKRALLVLASVLPTALAAQSNTTVSTYVAADGGVAGAPFLVGGTMTRESGWMAMRVGAGVDASSTLFGSSGAGEVGVVSGDVDALLYLGSPARLSSPLIPYVLAGAGARMLSGASSSAALTWGYGVGVRSPLGSRLSAEGEVRYREPVGAQAADAGQSRGLELRMGMVVRLGRGLARPSARVPVAVSRPLSAPTAAGPTSGTVAARRRVAERALDMADDYVGVRYTWGGNTPEEGFDCSGFVKFVFARQGITLPRVSRDQARAGTPLPLDIAALEPGDLIAFASDPGAVVDHIGIYVGDGRFIHSSSARNGVRIDNLYSREAMWYRTHMVAATRVIQGPALLAAE